MRRISVVGIGAGDPEHLTLQAVRVLNEVDVVFLTEKGEHAPELVDARRQICERVITDASGYRIVTIADPERDRAAPAYREAVEDWRRERAQKYTEAIVGELGEDGHGAILAWGDPAFYDSFLRMLDYVREITDVEFEVDVVAGISSPSALAARHGVTLTRTGRPVHITTGRLLAAHGMPDGCDDVVVMLDRDTSFEGLDPDVEIYWGAYIGTDQEILISGRLGDVAAEISAVKSGAREQLGWVMDTYLLRRSPKK